MKLNRHQIAGRIVEDPEYGSIPGSGIPTIKLRVVTDDGWYDTNKKEYQKRNTYHTVKRINKDVDNMELSKDDWVFVEGQKLTDSWEDRNGDKKYADYIRALHVVEIPDPWEKRERDRSSRDSGRGRDNRDRGRDTGRDRDRARGGSSGRDDRGYGRENRSRDRDHMPRPTDGIPF